MYYAVVSARKRLIKCKAHVESFPLLIIDLQSTVQVVSTVHLPHYNYLVTYEIRPVLHNSPVLKSEHLVIIYMIKESHNVYNIKLS